MNRARFEQLVDTAISTLPRQFRERLSNVAVIVESRPAKDLLERLEIPSGDTLFGLYEGVPLTERGFEAPLHPDRIWIFQEPIEQVCTTEAEVEREIQTTIMHEVAHFFGFEDEELEDMGY